MQFPVGPACIFLRKGIAEKQRVSWDDMEGWQEEQGNLEYGEKEQVLSNKRSRHSKHEMS